MSSDMLREVSDSLFELLIEAFPTSKSYTRNDIEQDPMPPLLAHFLGQTLQHRLDVEVEHIRTIRSTWFDYEHPDVQHAYKSFVAALAQYSHIPAEEWRSTLKRATKLVIAHLILPTHTLVEFVFREEDGPLVAPVIYREVSYFAAYPYLREAVEAFLKKRQLKEIDRTRFSSLLTQVDRHMTANYSVDQWMRMLRPLFDLMRRVPQTRNQGIPIDMLSMFFGDKEAYEIQGRLQVEKEVHRISTINEEALRRVIEGSVGPFEQELQETPQAVPASVKKQESEPPIAATHSFRPASEAMPPEPVVAPPAKEPEADDKPKPLWEQFQKSPVSNEEPEAPKETPQKPEGDDEAVPLWMRFQKSGVSAISAAIEPAQDGPSDAPPVADQPSAKFNPADFNRIEDGPANPADAEPSQGYQAGGYETDSPVVNQPPAEAPQENGEASYAGNSRYAEEAPVNEAPSATQPQDEFQAVPPPEHSAGFDTHPSEAAPSYSNPYTPPPSSPYASPDVAPAFPDIPAAPAYTQSLTPLEQIEHDVLGSFGAGNREMFVEHLFAGSSDDYERLLTLLRGQESWDDASRVIADEVFKRYQVNIYSPAAITFTEHVKEQFG